MELSHLIFALVSYLCAGTVISLGCVKHHNVGRRYYLYHGIGAVVIVVLAYVWFGKNVLATDAAYWLIGFVFTASVFSLWHLRFKRLGRAAYFLSLACALGFIILDITETAPSALHNRMILNSLLSALLLGFSIAAMLLGHWYLTLPKMPIEELKRISKILIALIEARFVWGTYVVGSLLWGKNESDIYAFILKHPGMFVLMRYLWGIVFPLVLSFFVWNTVKIRSTQSATGILYVLVLAVLTGEIISLYLSFYYGIAF